MRLFEQVINKYQTYVQLNEINMSPSGLTNQVNNIPGVKVGIEFEMYIPFILDPKVEPVEDQSIWGELDWFDFFTQSRYGQPPTNSEDDNDAEVGMTRWFNIALPYLYGKHRYQQMNPEQVKKLCYDNGMSVSEYQLSFEEKDKQVTKFNHYYGLYHTLGKILVSQMTKDVMEQIKIMTDTLGYHNMSDLPYKKYYYRWPSFYVPDTGTPISQEKLFDDLSQSLGKQIIEKEEFDSKNYTITKDGSLRHTNPGYNGVELVSPPISLPDMSVDLNKIIDWAKKYKCYTDTTTGLHLNISIPSYSKDNIDYVKLVLLMGDEYILQSLNRYMNRFTASSLKNIQSNLHNEVNCDRLLDQLRQKWNHGASQIIHKSLTQKYVSANLHDNRVEFRSPGGDWLNFGVPKIVNFIQRFVVALDAACDPYKHKQEYLSKLYKLIKSIDPQINPELIKHIEDYRFDLE